MAEKGSFVSTFLVEFAIMAKISFSTKYKKITCNIDTVKIGQVMRNLLDNAIKYGDGKPIVLELNKSQSEQSITIQIRNSGISMLEKEHKKVFEPFSLQLTQI